MNEASQAYASFLYLNGLGTDRSVRLSSHIQLLPATVDCHADLFLGLGKTDTDISVISLFLPHVKSQLRVEGLDDKDLAIKSWNALWDGLLLGALVGGEVMCNLNSDVPVEQLTPTSNIAVTNYQLRGFPRTSSPSLSESDIAWIELHYESAWTLLDDDAYRNAVHCLASYKWHSIPRAQLAILWSGIEGLFRVDSEIVFRVSLYTALFLEWSSKEKQRELFSRVKDLYKSRSRAVHGGKMKENAQKAVQDSAELLCCLIKRCAELKSLPNTSDLVP